MGKSDGIYCSLNYNFERIKTLKGSRPIAPEGYRNIKLTISFRGKGFCGYQYQPHALSVQQFLTEAIKTLTKEQVLLFSCSRLDALVSAADFVVNFYLKSEITCERLVSGLNGILQSTCDRGIAVYAACDMEPTFHARFDAVGKHYRYKIWYGQGQHALLFPLAWYLRSKTPPANLEAIVKQFTGTHDFAAFRAIDCQAKTTVRTIHKVNYALDSRFPELIIIDFWGDGFLKNMIRNLVGTAVDISLNKLPQTTVSDSFTHNNRTKTGQCAPPHPLVLEKIYYSRDEYHHDANT